MNSTEHRKKLYKEYIEHSELNLILKFDSDLLESFYDYMEMLEFLDSKHKRKPTNFIFSSIFGLVKAVFYGIYIRWRFKNSKIKEGDFLFVSSPALYNRFIEVNAYIPNSKIIYFPEFSHKILLSNLKQHKEKGNNVYIITYRLSTLFFYIKNLIRNRKVYKKIISLSKTTSPNIYVQNGVVAFIIRYILYERSIKKHDIFQDKLIVFDHDKAPYSFLLKQLTIRNVTLYHGSFIGCNLSYVKPLANNVLCSSKREKKTIIKYSNNIEEDNIFPVGIPLQSFESNKSVELLNKADKILILGSNEKYDEQINLLNHLNQMNIDYMYRFRPASKKEDFKALKEYINFESITDNLSLEKDCASYKKIISFSLDTLGTCIRNKNKILIYLSDYEYEICDMLGSCTNEIILTSDLDIVKDFILSPYKLIDKYSENTEKWIIDNIGCYQKDKVFDNIVSALSLISND